MCSDTNCREFRLPHARAGGVLIVAQGRVKHTDTIIYVVRQIAYIHRRESVLLEIREKKQKIHVEKEDYIHSTQLINSLAALAAAATIAALFLFHSLAHTHVLSLIFLSNISLLYRHFMVNMEGPIALKHGMNSGTIHASTCLVVGYCHKWQCRNRLLLQKEASFSRTN